MPKFTIEGPGNNQPPGTIPKRESERSGHRTKAELTRNGEPVRVSAPGSVDPGEIGFKTNNRITDELWEAAKASPIAYMYELTDWAQLKLHLLHVDKVVTEIMDPENKHRVSAVMLDSIMRGFSQFMYTEADRRRLRIEIDRTIEEEKAQDPVLIDLAAYRAAAEG